MDYKFVKLQMENSPPGSAELEGHRQIIEKYAQDGFRFVC
ncbi:MAG: DUF4177 domain-containing protein [Corallococcus sp.]|nr:DUF4177 domain-containing protein [Corallococcus sp.]